MLHSIAHVIRHADAADAVALRYLAARDGKPPLEGDVLVGEIAGRPAAAISLRDGRIVADPFQITSELAVLLRVRARALRAAQETPSLRDRIRDGVTVAPASRAA